MTRFFARFGPPAFAQANAGSLFQLGETNRSLPTRNLRGRPRTGFHRFDKLLPAFHR
jgi:hypothetical protein